MSSAEYSELRKIVEDAVRLAKRSGISDPLEALRGSGGLDRGLNEHDIGVVIEWVQGALVKAPWIEVLAEEDEFSGEQVAKSNTPVEFFDVSNLTGTGNELRKYVMARRDWVYPLHPNPDGRWTAECGVPRICFDGKARIRWHDAISMVLVVKNILKGPDAWRVLMCLESHANVTHGSDIKPSDELVAEEAGVKRQYVNPIRRDLRAYGWLTVVGWAKSDNGKPRPIDRLSVPMLVPPESSGQAESTWTPPPKGALAA